MIIVGSAQLLVGAATGWFCSLLVLLSAGPASAGVMQPRNTDPSRAIKFNISIPPAFCLAGMLPFAGLWRARPIYTSPSTEYRNLHYTQDYIHLKYCAPSVVFTWTSLFTYDGPESPYSPVDSPSWRIFYCR